MPLSLNHSHAQHVAINNREQKAEGDFQKGELLQQRHAQQQNGASNGGGKINSGGSNNRGRWRGIKEMKNGCGWGKEWAGDKKNNVSLTAEKRRGCV